MIGKGIFLFSVLMGAYCFCFAQNQSIDSLKKVIFNSENGMKVDAMNGLSLQLSRYDKAARVASIELAKEAYHLSEEINYSKGKIEALINQARMSVGNEAKNKYKLAITISHKNNEVALEGYSLACLGLYYESSRPDSSIYFYSKSLPLLEKEKQPYYLSFLYIVMAQYYGVIGKTELQLQYLEKSWEIRLKLPEKLYLPYAGVRLAAFYLKNGDTKKALTYLDRAQANLAGDTISNEEISMLNKQRASILANQGYLVEALRLFNQSKKYFESQSLNLELVNLLLESAEVLEDLGSYESSLKNSFEALQIADKNNYGYERTKILLRIAWIHFELNNLQLSKKFAAQALHAASKGNHSSEEASTLNLNGLIALQQGNLKESSNFFESALVIRQKINDQNGVASTLSNIGWVLSNEGKFAKAIEYQLKSLTLQTKLNDPVEKIYVLIRLGEVYIQTNNYEQAENYLTAAEELAHLTKASSPLVRIYELKRDLAAVKQNLSATLKYTKLFEHLKDSLFNQNSHTRMATINALYELDQKDRQIELNKEKLKSQQEKITQQSWVIWISIIGAVVIIASSLILALNYKKVQALHKDVVQSNKELGESKSEVEAQNEELTQQSEQIMAQRDLLINQNTKLEEARTIINNQNLQINKRNFDLEIEVEKRTEELIKYNQQLEQFAFISSHNLRAPVARILGLSNVLKLDKTWKEEEHPVHKHLFDTTTELDRVVRDLNTILEIKKNSSGVNTKIDFKEEIKLVTLSLEKEIQETQAQLICNFEDAPGVFTLRPYLDSILINLIGNAIKYRKPNSPPIIKIKTEHSDGYICLSIKDNGLGIDLSKYGEKLFGLYNRFHNHVEGHGLGLYLVKSQVTALGGEIEVESQVNEGSIFKVYLKDYREIIG